MSSNVKGSSHTFSLEWRRRVDFSCLPLTISKSLKPQEVRTALWLPWATGSTLICPRVLISWNAWENIKQPFCGPIFFGGTSKGKGSELRITGRAKNTCFPFLLRYRCPSAFFLASKTLFSEKWNEFTGRPRVHAMARTYTSKGSGTLGICIQQPGCPGCSNYSIPQQTM